MVAAAWSSAAALTGEIRTPTSMPALSTRYPDAAEAERALARGDTEAAYRAFVAVVDAAKRQGRSEDTVALQGEASRMLASAGRREQALNVLGAAIREARERRDHAGLGALFEAQADVQELTGFTAYVARALESAVTEYDRTPLARERARTRLRLAGQFLDTAPPRAIELLEQTLALTAGVGPLHTRVRASLGLAYVALRNRDLAAADLWLDRAQSAAIADPESLVADRVTTELLRARVAAVRGDLAGADKSVAEAAALADGAVGSASDRARLLVWVASELRDFGYIDQSIVIARRAEVVLEAAGVQVFDADRALPQQFIGYAELMAGRPAYAVAAFERALQVLPQQVRPEPFEADLRSRLPRWMSRIGVLTLLVEARLALGDRVMAKGLSESIGTSLQDAGSTDVVFAAGAAYVEADGDPARALFWGARLMQQIEEAERNPGVFPAAADLPLRVAKVIGTTREDIAIALAEASIRVAVKTGGPAEIYVAANRFLAQLRRPTYPAKADYHLKAAETIEQRIAARQTRLVQMTWPAPPR